jgi:hypothetical protein
MKYKALILSVGLLTLLVGFSLAAWAEFRPREMICATVPTPAANLPNCDAMYNAHRYAGTRDEWTRDLGRFHEMPMPDLPACAEESYRIVWIPAFHHPISVRIWRSRDGYFATSKRLNGRGGYDWGKLDAEDTRALTDDEWVEATRVLRASGFWDLSPADPQEPPEDGALWVIEGRTGERSVAVRRRSATQSFAEACAFVLALSGWKTETDHYYTPRRSEN